MENGLGGGFTGATGRSGISVRGRTTRGGRDPGGCPSASRNLRIRSASDSSGADAIGRVVDVDLAVGSLDFLAALFAALVNQRNNIATSTSKKKTGVSMCISE